MPSLYRRILGPRFEALPEVLRRFHDLPGGGRAKGSLEIERATCRPGNALAGLLGLPRTGEDVAVVLEVKVQGDKERWVRHMQGRTLETVQWMKGEWLMEALGPWAFASRMVVDGSEMRYEFQRAWFLGIPVPRWIAPFVDGGVDAGEGGWRVTVRIVAPIFGELVRYEGWIVPE
ncbi:MAG: hypothetical protein JWN86_2061 [Planctomycetota bacterium]|nr:hypothetical protein [Planctomycetota bacterium]